MRDLGAVLAGRVAWRAGGTLLLPAGGTTDVEYALGCSYEGAGGDQAEADSQQPRDREGREDHDPAGCSSRPTWHSIPSPSARARAYEVSREKVMATPARRAS